MRARKPVCLVPLDSHNVPSGRATTIATSTVTTTTITTYMHAVQLRGGGDAPLAPQRIVRDDSPTAHARPRSAPPRRRPRQHEAAAATIPAKLATRQWGSHGVRGGRNALRSVRDIYRGVCVLRPPGSGSCSTHALRSCVHVQRHVCCHPGSAAVLRAVCLSTSK